VGKDACSFLSISVQPLYRCPQTKISKAVLLISDKTVRGEKVIEVMIFLQV
jgi:hypothetical protein